MNPTAPTSPATTRTNTLLKCGVAAGILFVATVLIQMATREGFDPRQHPLSMLALGDLGWIQTGNFIIAGLLTGACAIGLRRALHPGPAGTWGPLLIGANGLALIWAGVFVTDPAEGFPLGTPDGPPVMSWHGALHNIAPTVIGLALMAACFVFARRFARLGRRGWVIYCLATPVAYLGLGFAAFPADDFRLLLAGFIAIFVWPSAITLQLINQPTSAPI